MARSGSRRCFAEDVAKVVAAIDDRRDPIDGIWSIGGPEELTADEVFEIVGEGGEPAHLDPVIGLPALSALLEIPVSVRATELFAADSVADAPDAGSRVRSLDDCRSRRVSARSPRR